MLTTTPESPARTCPPALNVGRSCSSILYPSGSPAGAIKVQQKDGEDTSFCRNLEGMLVRHLNHVRSTSNPLHQGFGSSSLLLCGILHYCKMALKFCPSGERCGQQRRPGKNHRHQPHAWEYCRLCGDMSQAGLGETRCLAGPGIG